jgi:hypothetical protein
MQSVIILPFDSLTGAAMAFDALEAEDLTTLRLRFRALEPGLAQRKAKQRQPDEALD